MPSFHMGAVDTNSDPYIFTESTLLSEPSLQHRKVLSRQLQINGFLHYFAGSTGDWTHGLGHARQELCYWASALAPVMMISNYIMPIVFVISVITLKGFSMKHSDHGHKATACSEPKLQHSDSVKLVQGKEWMNKSWRNEWWMNEWVSEHCPSGTIKLERVETGVWARL